MKYNKKGIIGITLAAIMIASIFAAIAPSTTADVKPLSEFATAKHTIDAGGNVDDSLAYSVGDTIHYNITFTNTDQNYECTLDLWDVLPNGAIVNFADDYLFMIDEKVSYDYYYVVKATDVRDPVGMFPYKHVFNIAYAQGWNNVSDPIDDSKGKYSRILEEELPVFVFDVDHICCYNMSFDGSASFDPDGYIQNHTWVFDSVEDGPHAGAPGVKTYKFSGCGNHNVELKGYDNRSNFNTTGTVGIYVPCDPTAVATATKSVVESGAGEEVTFMCAGSHVDPAAPVEYGLTLSYHWEFDDSLTGDNDDGCDTTREVDGVDGDIICGTLTVNDTHCNDTATVCVRVREVSECKLRVYGFLDEGAGDYGIGDPETDLSPENPPYTDPMAPFYPQAEQAPRKDFITFDPIIMYHNDHNGWLNEGPVDTVYKVSIKNAGADASEKIFKRMWYEPTEWYKDEDRDGRLDFVFVKGDDKIGWVDDPAEMHDLIVDGWTRAPWNSDEQLGDIYAPSIKQEFTFMMLDPERCPEPAFAPTGIPHSSMLIPAATRVADNGIDSFDVDGDGDPDRVLIESEYSLCMDIDNDGRGEINPDCPEAGPLERLSEDGGELTGDETLVLTTEEITLAVNDPMYSDTLQFFDHKIVLKDVFGELPVGPEAKIRIYYQGETSPPGVLTIPLISMGADETRYFTMGQDNTGATPQGPFFITIIGAPDGYEDKVTVRIGRMFGNTWANVGANPYWNQKHFYVDSVCYNVVAIKTDGYENFKYITFRQKLPKVGIKINQHTQWLKGWDEKEILAEMPQYNMPHTIIQDVQRDWTVPDPLNPICDKIGEYKDVPALEIEYNLETTEPRFHGELKELYYEEDGYEGWMVEWFQTLPWEYTLFRLPPEDDGGIYMLTSAFYAPEGWGVLWDGGEVIGEPWFGQRLKFWYQDCSGPLFVDWRNGTLRVYGYLDQGAGNPEACYVEEPCPENPAYTDPMAPFLPQADQAPDKDFVTFNPILMYHNDDDWNNDGTLDTVYKTSIRNNYGDASEKIFKRMWYEPTEWYKDEDNFGELDLVLINATTGVVVDSIPAWVLKEEPWVILDLYLEGLVIKESNDDEALGDLYAPSIKQEFTYMMLDSGGCPEPAFAPTGGSSSMLIPMATWESGNGLDSFDADGFDGVPEGTPDRVIIESEDSLGFDIDGDGIEQLSEDGDELTGDETLVLTLDEKTLSLPTATPRYPNTIQFFDHKLILEDVKGAPGSEVAKFQVWYQGEVTQWHTIDVEIGIGERKFLCQGQDNTGATPQGPFFVEVTNVDPGEDKVTVKVGRMFGETWANVGWLYETGNMAWGFQKQFYVDGVCYNVVAIKTDDYENFKYITFRQKLPKVPIKIEQHSVLLKGWDKYEILPELPQFNMRHTILQDIQADWTIPEYVCDKLGEPLDAEALEITYTSEEPEPRFHGELKEIYYEEDGYESWMIEWFQTIPYQYTGFELPTGHGLYLVTSAFYAPESVYHFWDGGEPIGSPRIDSRLKYWFDPGDMTDIYVNKPPKPVDLEIWEFYDLATYGGNGNGEVDLPEVMNAYSDYVCGFGEGMYPFGPEAIYTDEDLIDLILMYLGYL